MSEGIKFKDVEEDIRDFINQADETLEEIADTAKMIKDLEATRNRAHHFLVNFDKILSEDTLNEMTRSEFDDFFIQYVTQNRKTE